MKPTRCYIVVCERDGRTFHYDRPFDTVAEARSYGDSWLTKQPSDGRPAAYYIDQNGLEVDR